MNKTEFISIVAEKSGITKTSAEKIVNNMINTISDELVRGGTVSFVGFGKFETCKRAARKGFNPQTREPVKIAARMAPVFRAGATLKNAVIAAGKSKKKQKK